MEAGESGWALGLESSENGGVGGGLGVDQTDQHGAIAAGEEEAGVAVVFHLALRVEDGGEDVLIVGLVVLDDMVPDVGGDRVEGVVSDDAIVGTTAFEGLEEIRMGSGSGIDGDRVG